MEDDKERGSKQNVISAEYPKEKYDMEEEDFLSAELEIVPAGKARAWSGQKYIAAGQAADRWQRCAYTSACNAWDDNS